MNLTSIRGHRRQGTPVSAGADEHHAIKRIGGVLVVSIVVLMTACLVMLSSGIMVRQIYERQATADQHVRATNAIDLIISQSGPLDQADAEIIGRVAGLKNARLSATAPTDTTARKIPLLGEQASQARYLVWDQDSFADDMFRLFAPIRLPTVAAMMVMVIGLMFYVRRQVSDIERQRRLALIQSRTDVVTGLPNRLAFEAAIAELTNSATPFGLVLLDLDEFKAVNDSLGHAAGDSVLRIVGERLSGLLGPGDLLARLGGDEFVILCVSKPAAVALAPLAYRVIACVEQPVELLDGAVQVGISLGIVADIRGDLLPETVLAAADAALYRAKARRGSSVEFAGQPPQPLAPAQLECA